MRRRVQLLLAAFAVCGALHPISAQKFLPQSIRFQGASGYSDEELLAAAGLQKGAVLSSEEMNASAKKLMNSGVFDQLGYKFDGQDLVFTMSVSTDLLPMRIENLPLMPGDELNAELHKQFPLFHGKVPAEGGLLDEVRGALEQKLADEGIKVSVTAEPYGEKKQSRKVTAMSFSIDAPPVRQGPVHIEGATASFLPRVQATAALAATLPFESDDPVSVLEHNIAALYEDQGYAAVKVTATRSGPPVMTSEAIEVPYIFTIDEGRIYKTIAIHIPAGALVTQEEINKTVASKGTALHEAVSLIERKYRANGYLDLVVTPHPEFNDSDATVTYTMDINTGAVYHLGFVKFDNVSEQLRNLLIRYWQMIPGDTFDESYLLTFIAKAEEQNPVLLHSLMGAMSKIETEADPVTHSVNVVIRLEK
jgi:outer membrane protein assembly factor BamA